MSRPSRRTTTRRAFPLLAACALAAAWADARAEVMFEYRPRWMATDSAVRFHHWKTTFGDSSSTVEQLSIPVRTSSPISRNLDLAVHFWVVSSNLDVERGTQPAPSIGLGGLTDIKAVGLYRFLRNHLMLGVGVNLPTGKTRFTPDEEVLWNAISNRLLGFPVRYMGEGLNLDLNLIGAHDLDPRLVLGGALGYEIKGEFDLRENAQVTYRPGNEVSASIGLEYGGERTSWRLEGALRTFGTDKRDGEDELREGAQLELGARVTTVTGAGKINLRLGNLFKANTEFVRAGIKTSSFKNLNGNIFFAGGDLTRVLSEWADGILRLGVGLFGENDQGEGDGTIWDLGLGTRVKLSSAVIASVDFAYLFGSAEDGRVDLDGFDLAAGVSLLY